MFDLASAQQQLQGQQAALPVSPPAQPGFANPAVSQMLRAPAKPAAPGPVSNFAAGPQMLGNPAPRTSAPMGGLGVPRQPMPLGAPGMGGFGALGAKPGKGGGGVGGGGKSRPSIPQFRR